MAVHHSEWPFAGVICSAAVCRLCALHRFKFCQQCFFRAGIQGIAAEPGYQFVDNHDHDYPGYTVCLHPDPLGFQPQIMGRDIR